MKKPVITSLVLSLAVFSSQAVFSDVKASEQHNNTVQTPPATQTHNGPSWLGVWIEDIPISLAKHIAPLIKDNQGVIIRKVSPNSPAQAAGLQKYDVITAFNDQEIYSQKQLTALVKGTAPDTKVKLDIIHQGKPVSKEVILSAAPRQSQTYQGPQQRPWPPVSQFQRPGSRQQPGSRGLLPPPSWLNDPFFQQGFKHPLPPINAPLKQDMPPAGQSKSWSESHFESIEIEASGDDKIRAAVKYQDNDGNKKEFVFEGNQNEIRKQIMDQKDMDDNRKQHLLQALDMSNAPPRIPEIPVPDWFNQSFQPPPWFNHRQ